MPAVPPDTAGAFSTELCLALGRLGREHRLGRPDAVFRRALRARRFDALQSRALCAISAGAAIRHFAAGGESPAFAERVEYNGRRLAKLNVPPTIALQTLAGYPSPGGESWKEALNSLQLAVALGLQTAYYQVREAEAQLFYGLFRAETEAADLDEMLRRFIAAIARALKAQAGRLALAEPAGVGRRLSAPLYIEAGSPRVSLILDPTMRGRYASYWSIPFREGGEVVAVAQFGFATPYRWLPRELTLLEACAERCVSALRRARLARDLSERERQVRELAGHLMTAGEEERRRISRELHDEAGQTLLLLRLELEKLERESGPDGREGLARARELAGHAIEEVRRAVAALSPAVLERMGLAAALRRMVVRQFKSLTAGARVHVANSLPALTPALETAVYRLAQECCQNIARHSGASRVKVSLAPSDGWLELSVTDNGRGFDVQAALRKPDSFGLAGMRERVAQLGGVLEIRSRPGRGTRVAARLPLPAAAALQ